MRADKLLPAELQELVFMTGSKKAFGTYLGIEPKEVDVLFIEHGLMTAIEYLKAAPGFVADELPKFGSAKKMAAHYGVSESFVKSLLPVERPPACTWSVEDFEQEIPRYGSVKFAARCRGLTEAAIRKRAKELGIELAPLLDFTTGKNENAKGRRAELAWQAIRKAEGLELTDRNIVDGSQATYDFDDPQLGKVNVKSSRAFRYTAQTRAEDPWHWKFSTRGWDAADTLVLMFYTKDGDRLIGWSTVRAEDEAPGATITKQMADVHHFVPEASAA